MPGTAIDRDRGANASPLPSGSLGAIMGNFKSITTRRINQLRSTPGQPVWQRNYYEHIIRHDNELNAIRQYILDNPGNWIMDAENPNRSS
ncbi:MAG TPA: transposase [Anaerolineae bacterium]